MFNVKPNHNFIKLCTFSIKSLPDLFVWFETIFLKKYADFESDHNCFLKIKCQCNLHCKLKHIFLLSNFLHTFFNIWCFKNWSYVRYSCLFKVIVLIQSIFSTFNSDFYYGNTSGPILFVTLNLDANMWVIVIHSVQCNS